MAKKKTEKVVSDFDLNKALEEKELFDFYKRAFLMYIENNGIEIKSEKDLNKYLKEFGGE